MVSVKNCRTMSDRRRTQCAADADLTSPFGNGRQHDVHDPDATNDQRNTGNDSHEDDEHDARVAGLVEQFLGNDHRRVAQFPMVLF